jgi:acyl-CoA thioesterase YciA
MSDTPRVPPDTEPALRAIAMPADANPHGDIFGGWILSQMDLAGGSVAARRAKGRTVTVAITGMTFHRPVFIGDVVTCYATIIKVGNTSITVKVESWVRRGIGQELIEVTEGIFTYVAVGVDRRPCPVPLGE